jgi:hypothetical protein
MNVRLQYDTTLTAGVYYNDQFAMNNYDVRVHFQTNSVNAEDHNVGLSRIKHFIHESLDSTVFIHSNNLKQARKFLAADCTVATLPEEPVDQIIGMMLYCKLNAICEDRLHITELELSSDLGDNIMYKHSYLEPLGPFDTQGWWHLSNLAQCDPKLLTKLLSGDSQVVKLTRGDDWSELGLAWANVKEITTVDSSTVVYAQFNKDEN